MKQFPFSALVGQNRLKTAYLANIVNPNIGGLLISGVKGTGKSTVVRSVESILPEYNAVANCPFNCDPNNPQNFCSLCREKDHHNSEQKQMRVINLPLSVSEDRLIGSVEIEKLLKTGQKDIQVGILGQANRNILYIDEVNLLPDHIVDDILDAAASHWNTIEREGFSISHPANFILVGTMNPEEGDLRPQILDRFPLGVKIQTVIDPDQRVEIIKRNLMFESDPNRFREYYQNQAEKLKQRIIDARKLLPEILVLDDHLLAVASACAELKVDGQRPDIVIFRVAQSTAALERRDQVENKDILLAALLALMHRTRDGGLMGPPDEDEINEIFLKHLKNSGKNVKSSFIPSKALETLKENNKIDFSSGDSLGKINTESEKKKR